MHRTQNAYKEEEKIHGSNVLDKGKKESSIATKGPSVTKGAQGRGNYGVQMQNWGVQIQLLRVLC